MRIVIAADPIPVAAALKLGQESEIVGHQIVGALAAVEAVTERHHPARIDGGDDLAEAGKGGTGVVRRQQHAERGKGGALLQMQVGDEKRVLRLPLEGAGGKRLERMARDVDMGAERGRRFRHEIGPSAQHVPPMLQR